MASTMLNREDLLVIVYPIQLRMLLTFLAARAHLYIKSKIIVVLLWKRKG